MNLWGRLGVVDKHLLVSSRVLIGSHANEFDKEVPECLDRRLEICDHLVGSFDVRVGGHGRCGCNSNDTRGGGAGSRQGSLSRRTSGRRGR